MVGYLIGMTKTLQEIRMVYTASIAVMRGQAPRLTGGGGSAMDAESAAAVFSYSKVKLGDRPTRLIAATLIGTVQYDQHDDVLHYNVIYPRHTVCGRGCEDESRHEDSVKAKKTKNNRHVRTSREPNAPSRRLAPVPILVAFGAALLIAGPSPHAARAQTAAPTANPATSSAVAAPAMPTAPAFASPPAPASAQPAAPAAAPAPDAAAPVAPTAAPAATPSAAPPASSAAEPEPGQPTVGRAQLPQDLSPWGMFLNADLVVKIVIVGLAFASLVTWTVYVAKMLELRTARRDVRKGLRILTNAATLAQAHDQLRDGSTPVAQLMQAAAQEIRLSAAARGDGLKERIAWQLERLEMATSRRVSRGTGVLATIGSTAPFIGLFGTVWGIMNSFIGISNAHTTNLAVVAPGIAQALLATALGLVAAIPAVMIYNVLARSTAHYRALLGDASAQVMRLVSRDFDRAKLPLAHAAE